MKSCIFISGGKLMSQQQGLTLYQQQKNAKPKIEDVINDLLDNERKKSALGFITFLKSYRMTPQWASLNAWSVKYKGKLVCSIKFYDLRIYMDKGTWRICHSGEYSNGYESLLSEETVKDIAWKNVYFCRNCAGTINSHSIHSLILGKEFDNVCPYFKIQFENPDADMLRCARRLVEIRRASITTMN